MSEQKANRKSNGQFAPGYTPPTAWKKGQSGNLNGRHGSCADLFKELSEAKDDKGITKKQKILTKIIQMAENGSLKAAQIYMDRMEGKPMSEAQREYFKQSLKTGIRSIGTVADPAKIPQGARLVWGPEDLRAPTQKTNPFMRAKLRVNNRVRETIPYATMAPFLSVEGMRQRHETRKMPAVKATKEPSKPVVSRSEQIRKEIMEHKPFDMELRPLKQRKPAQIKRVK